MASFEEAFKATLAHEGDYVDDPDDSGGETYKGVARNKNPDWPGWKTIDLLKSQEGFPENLESDKTLQQQVRDLYKSEYWDRISGDRIDNQAIAESIFDFAVNSGTGTSSKLAQMAVGADTDGIIGPKTLKKLNSEDPRTFLSVFALNKIERYVAICEKRPHNRKYFYGWVQRALQGVPA